MPDLIYFIYLIPLSLCAIFSLRSFRLKWPNEYKYFSIFLIITLLNEIFAVWWKVSLYKVVNGSPSNIWIYNIYIILEYLFFFCFFYLALKKYIQKKTIVVLSIAYGVFAVSDITWIQQVSNLNSYTIILGNLALIFLSLAYFNKTLHEKTATRQTSLPLFWISMAVFISSAGSLPYFIFMNYLVKTNIAMAIALFNILLILNTLMYSLFLIAYLCNPHNQK